MVAWRKTVATRTRSTLDGTLLTGMRPFGWLPNWPKWSFKPSESIPDAPETRQPRVAQKTVLQRVNNAWIATLKVDCAQDELHKYEELSNLDSARSGASSWDEGLDVNGLWNSHAENAHIEMDPSLPPGHLKDKCEELLLGNGPLVFLPKLILPKARIGMEANMYMSSLRALLLSPSELDAKYSLDETNNAFLAHLKQLVDDTRPLSAVVKDLRRRDTQLQVILGMELIASQLSTCSSSPEPLPGHSSENQEVSDITDQHFDRLCIWQAIENTDLMNEFCSTILIPYYKSRVAKKTKQLVRISRGTVKHRNKQSKSIARKPKRTSQRRFPAALPSTSGSIAPSLSLSSLPGLEPSPALLKALQMENTLVPSNNSSSDLVSSDSRDGSRPGKLASRSVSHPVYRQPSRHSQVEVRFKKGRRRDPGAKDPSAKEPSPVFTVPPSRSHTPVPEVPRAPEPRRVPPPQTEVIEATPTKVRTSYLESLPPQTTLFENEQDDDAIGSTDSDE